MATVVLRLTDVPEGVKCETHVEAAGENDKPDKLSPAMMIAAVITARLVEEPAFPFPERPAVALMEVGMN